MSDNVWAWYQAALKNPAEIGKSISVHDGEPQVGYYRTRNQDKSFDPVAIYFAGEELVALRGERQVSPENIWTFCCRHPVSYAVWKAAIDGKGWPDADPVIEEQLKGDAERAKASVADAPAPPADQSVGANSGELDEREVLKDQIDSLIAGAKKYETIADDATASKAQSARNRLNKLSGKADKKREALKRPHLDAGKAVDDAWQPLVKGAKAGADAIRKALGAWETKKLNDRLAEEEDKRKRQFDEDEARRQIEEASRAATNRTQEPVGEQQAAPATDTPPAPETRMDGQTGRISAGYGKAASVSTRTVVDTDKEIDWTKLAVYMSAHPECKALLLALAQRAVDAGREVPGIQLKQEAVVK